MRHTLTQLPATENLPRCDHCGASLVFANTADLSKDGRVYLIFNCVACSAGETKVWRAEWQVLADSLAVDD